MPDFDSLLEQALHQWPAELRLPVRLSAAGHQVEGLAELERSISKTWTADPNAILMRTLHWNILRAVHLAFADSDIVEPASLPSVRRRFEEDLRILGHSLHVTEADRLTIRAYLAQQDRNIHVPDTARTSVPVHAHG
jgi:hypothetical protein